MKLGVFAVQLAIQEPNVWAIMTNSYNLHSDRIRELEFFGCFVAWSFKCFEVKHLQLF